MFACLIDLVHGLDSTTFFSLACQGALSSRNGHGHHRPIASHTLFTTYARIGPSTVVFRPEEHVGQIQERPTPVALIPPPYVAYGHEQHHRCDARSEPVLVSIVNVVCTIRRELEEDIVGVFSDPSPSPRPG